MPTHNDPLFHVFLSHGSATDDRPDESPAEVQEFADALRAALEALDARRAGGITLDYDVDGIRPGDDWFARIDHFVARADAALVLLTKRSVGRYWVHAEAVMLAYRARRQRLPLIAVELERGAFDELREGGREYGDRWRPGEWHVDPAFLASGPARLGTPQPIRRGSDPDLSGLVRRVAEVLLREAEWPLSRDEDWNSAVLRLAELFPSGEGGLDRIRRIAGSRGFALDGDARSLTKRLITTQLLKSPDEIHRHPPTSYVSGTQPLTAVADVLNEVAPSDPPDWAHRLLDEVKHFWPDPRAATAIVANHPDDGPRPAARPAVRFRAVSFSQAGAETEPNALGIPAAVRERSDQLRWHVARAHLARRTAPRVVPLQANIFNDPSYGSVLTRNPADTVYFDVRLESWSELHPVLEELRNFSEWPSNPDMTRTFVFSLKAGCDDQPEEVESTDGLVWIEPVLRREAENAVKEEFYRAVANLGGLPASRPDGRTATAGRVGRRRPPSSRARPRSRG